MSWAQFEREVVEKMESQGLKDAAAFAKFFSTKYDQCVKRGVDVVTKNNISKGNINVMQSTLESVLTVAAAYKMNNIFDLYFNLIGASVVSYWAGATLNKAKIPLLPAVGSTSNMGVKQNYITFPGSWPQVQQPPMKDARAFVNSFIMYAKIHLTTITGICETSSIYPPAGTLMDGFVPWMGYKIPDGIKIDIPKFSTMLFNGAKVNYTGTGTGHKGQEGWQSGNAADIVAPVGTPCYTPIGGIVEKVNDYGPTVIERDGKRLFGAGVTIRGENGKKVYMAHMKNLGKTIIIGTPILQGTFVGEVMLFPTDPTFNHLHIGFITGTTFEDYMEVDGKGTFR